MIEKLKDTILEIINPLGVNAVDEGGNVKILVPSSIEDGEIHENLLKEGEIDLERINPKQFLTKGDILFQSKGNKFEVILIENDYENLLANQLYFIIRVDLDKIDPKYLQWLLKTDKAQEYFEKNTSGTTMKIVRKTTLENFEFSCPSLTDQEKLVTLIREFEKEKRETLRYLKNKEELIERKILSKYEVK